MICLRQFVLPLAVCCSTTTLLSQNDIQVLGDAVFTPAEIAEGATASYLIRFQNVGTDTAYQIIIRDTLDPRFDLLSFNMIGASHNYDLVQDGSNIIRWYFDDIFLPDSSSGGSNSLGFVLFTIRPKTFLAPGQTIINRSCITFNQTNTTCTNEATIWIDANADIDEPDKEYSYRIVPNPNYGAFEVRSTATIALDPDTPPAEWWITDINGKMVWDGYAKDMATANTQVLLERPAPGLYLLWVKDKERLQVQVIAVIR